VTRITELPEIVVLADDDYLTAVDVSDMSESPTGKNVKIQKQNLLAGMVVKEEIARLSGGTSTIDFTALNLSSYDRVWMTGMLGSSLASTASGLSVVLNAASAVNSWRQSLEANDGSPANTNESADGNVIVVPGSDATQTTAPVSVWIEAPGVTGPKVLISEYGFRYASISGRVGFRMVASDVTAPITQITVTTGGADTLSGTLILYGERTI
jgi:hypothetical protein